MPQAYRRSDNIEGLNLGTALGTSALHMYSSILHNQAYLRLRADQASIHQPGHIQAGVRKNRISGDPLLNQKSCDQTDLETLRLDLITGPRNHSRYDSMEKSLKGLAEVARRCVSIPSVIIVPLL